MTSMEFNINDFVRVRLTERGRQLHLQNYYRLRRIIPCDVEYPYTPPKEDAEGWSEWQLWVLMREFGAAMNNGSEPVFDTTIRIVRDTTLPEQVAAPIEMLLMGLGVTPKYMRCGMCENKFDAFPRGGPLETLFCPICGSDEIERIVTAESMDTVAQSHVGQSVVEAMEGGE